MNYPTRKSRFFLTPYHLLLFSTILYFSPYFIGSFEYITSYRQRVIQLYSAEVGWVVIFILVMLLCVTFVVARKSIVIGGRRQSKSEANVLFVILFSLLTFVVLDGNIFSLNKADMLEGTTRFHLMFYQVSAVSVVYCALIGFDKNRLLFFTSSLCLLLILYAGHRSTLMIAAVSTAYIFFRSKPMTRRFFKLIVVAVFLLFFLSVYKSVYVAIKSSNWDLVMLRLSPENLTASIMTGMEQFVTFAHLDFVVSTDFRLECSNIWLVPITIIPFMNELLEPILDVERCSYNAQVQPTFFSGYAGGVAANIWAEFYALLGFWGFPILVLLLGAFYTVFEHFIQRLKSPLLVSGLIIAMVNMSFYIQRKEFLSGFISAKRVIIIVLIVYFITWFLRRATRSRSMIRAY